MLLLDVGTANGVRVFDPVVTADGLIGSIVSAGPHSSNALTWVNPDFAASAMTADGRVRGFVHAANVSRASGPMLELHGVALRDSLAIGTIVMTAGAGGVYPDRHPDRPCGVGWQGREWLRSHLPGRAVRVSGERQSRAGAGDATRFGLSEAASR